MPQIFKIGSYLVYFWIAEGRPLEPVHVHIAQGTPISNATKIWITQKGNCLLCNNNSKIPPRTLRSIMKIIEIRSDDIINLWLTTFGSISYYC